VECAGSVADHREHHRLRSQACCEWLARLHHIETGRAPGNQAIANAQSVLAGKAKFDGPTHPVAVRVAGLNHAVYLDIADSTWQAIEVTATGWRIIANPPVKFTRWSGMLPLPIPTSGTSIDALRELVPLADDDAF
jgi:hypothetical protein